MRAWMSCYALLGFVQTGMLPIILPLSAPPGPEAGLTYAAYSITGIAAPFIGALSDRARRHRLTLTLGLALAAAGLLAHGLLPPGLAAHCLAAAAIGLGVSAASTVGTMFVVEVEPEPSWDPGIGRLQSVTSLGQLAGLLAAGGIGLAHVGWSFVLAGGLLAVAVPLALRFAPDPVEAVPRHGLRPRPPTTGELATGGTQRALHRPNLALVAGFARGRMPVFLAIWLLSYTATNALSVMFAPALVRGMHAHALWPTASYAIGVAVSLTLFPLAARWDRAYGPFHVLAGGLALRVVVVGTMAGSAFLDDRSTLAVLLATFGLMQVIWPALSVASTAIAVRLSPGRAAGSVGLLNATSSVGATLGGIVSGSLLGAGFGWFCAIVVLCLVAALALARTQFERTAPAG